MSDFKIRVAKPGDELGIHLAHMRSIREICVKDHGEEEIKGWGNRPLGTRWTETIRSGFVWVVESGGSIFGLGYIRIFEENAEKKAHIHGLYLTPEALGKGLGKNLAQLMLDTARAAEAYTVTLESTLTAHEFCKKLGFADQGPMKTQMIAGHSVRYFPMACRLK